MSEHKRKWRVLEGEAVPQCLRAVAVLVWLMAFYEVALSLPYLSVPTDVDLTQGDKIIDFWYRLYGILFIFCTAALKGLLLWAGAVVVQRVGELAADYDRQAAGHDPLSQRYRIPTGSRQPERYPRLLEGFSYLPLIFFVFYALALFLAVLIPFLTGNGIDRTTQYQLDAAFCYRLLQYVVRGLMLFYIMRGLAQLLRGVRCMKAALTAPSS